MLDTPQILSDEIRDVISGRILDILNEEAPNLGVSGVEIEDVTQPNPEKPIYRIWYSFEDKHDKLFRNNDYFTFYNPREAFVEDFRRLESHEPI